MDMAGLNRTKCKMDIKKLQKLAGIQITEEWRNINQTASSLLIDIERLTGLFNKKTDKQPTSELKQALSTVAAELDKFIEGE